MRRIAVIATIFAGIQAGNAQEPWEIKDGVYGHVFDTTSVWHPEQIHIVRPDMYLEFRLPREQDQSGVANIFFRNRDALKAVRTQDYVRDNRRYASIIEPGRYDVILLYNNGKYIVYPGLNFEKEKKTVVDMGLQPVLPADSESRQWLLERRKFTDVVGGKRTVVKASPAVSPHKVAGYIFDYKREIDQSVDVQSVTEDGNNSSVAPKTTLSVYFQFVTEDSDNKYKYAGGISEDGYFEVDLDDADTIYKLRVCTSPFFIPGFQVHNGYHIFSVKANTWYFIVREETLAFGPYVKWGYSI